MATNTYPHETLNPENRTSATNQRLHNAYEERKERINWTSIFLLLIAVVVLAYAAYVWYANGYNRMSLSNWTHPGAQITQTTPGDTNGQ